MPDPGSYASLPAALWRPKVDKAIHERRAGAVRDALVSRGIAGERIRVKPLGESFPVADNDSAAGRQQNRRVEIVFSDAEGKFAGNAERSARVNP